MTIILNPNRPGCYRISASIPGEVHDIDLHVLDGNGRCGCANFIFRMEDKVQAGSFGLVCKHIVAARKFDLLRRRGVRA